MRITMKDIRKINGCNSIHIVKWFARAYNLDMNELIEKGWDIERLKAIDDEICRRIVNKFEAEHGR